MDEKLIEAAAKATWESEGWHTYATAHPDAEPIYSKWEDLSVEEKQIRKVGAVKAIAAHLKHLADNGMVIVPRRWAHSVPVNPDDLTPMKVVTVVNTNTEGEDDD